MKERPIIFNAEMVRAILDGRKTQTRRLVPEWQIPSETKQDAGDYPDNRWMAVAQRDRRWGFVVFGATEESCAAQLTESLCPFGSRDDRLWVRETFAVGLCTKSTMAYRATHKPIDLDEGWDEVIKWRPSIHMPRWASRIQLEITGARVERLNAISEDDAMAEGMDDGTSAAAIAVGWFEKPQRAYQRLWEQMYGEDSWASNPWVWVIQFKRVEGGAA
jgi:hypothetical protein